MQCFVSAVLTAAGLSSRMGRPKPLLPWRGKTLVESQIQSLLEAGANEVIVVLGHEAEEVAPYVSGKAVRDVMNPLYKEGRTSSIRAGLEAVSPDATDIVIMAVDQPRTPQIVSDVINAHLEAGALLTSPRYLGRGGHPLYFPRVSSRNSVGFPRRTRDSGRYSNAIVQRSMKWYLTIRQFAST